jgi:dienelactone hydrolase
VMMGGMETSADPGDAPLPPGHPPYLPEPTGPRPVGTTSLYLKDVSRPDPWAAGVNARELMVSVWYPAAPSDGPRARYMTPAESELQLTSRGITGIPAEVLGTVRTNAASGAASAEPQRALPLVLLSPGFTNARSALTALAEDLASHGYVVAGIDHTYESYATAFPDGRVTTCLARQAPGRGPGFREKVMAGRAADACFVLDELTAGHPAWPGAGLIDPSRIAMAGHSAGGAAAIAAMLADSRIRAGIDMDGTTHAPIPDHGLSRPFLFLGKQSNYTPGSGGNVTTWERDWKLLTGWKRWLLVAGAIHAYVRAFFDQHLRRTPQALPDQPSPRYPEVTFCSPDTKTCV